METIKNYLENMFRSLPRTEEIERLKRELLSNMEEKYNELKKEGRLEHEAVGIVISEFGNIDELLEELDLKVENHKEVYPIMRLEEAREFITVKGKTSYLIGVGVGLILIGVSLLILLITLLQSNYVFDELSKNNQGMLPVIALFLFIAPAVGLFIYCGTKLDKYKDIEEGHFGLSSETKAVLNKELSAVSSRQNIGTIIGVMLCVLSPMAIFIASLFGENITLYGVSVLLLMIAVAVFIFITTGSSAEAYKKLLKVEDFSPERQKENKVIGAIAGIVWPIAVCIFLFCGFIFDLWHIAWIIFPMTGILFGGFCAFYNTIKSN